MFTSGQANYARTNINSYVAFVFIAVYAFGIGLVLWYAAFNTNPIANLLTKDVAASTALPQNTTSK